jgi:uncharacterized membrane protein
MLACGVREMATGMGLLTRPRPASFAWGRVAGDALDLAVLGKALTSDHGGRSRVAAAAAAVVGVTILDIVAGVKLSRPANGAAGEQRRKRGIRVRKAITVNNSPEEAYTFWRNFENLPWFMAHLESVRVMDHRRSYWKAKAPLGATVEWVAEITEDRSNQLIAWRSLEGSDAPNFGQVRFIPAPGDRGAEVNLELMYHPPGGIIGATVASCSARSLRSRWTATCGGSSRCWRPAKWSTPGTGLEVPAGVVMKATCWEGRRKVRVENVPEPHRG